MIARIKVSDYHVSERRFVALAEEFGGRAQLPAGNHQVAEVAFDEEIEGLLPYEMHQRFLAVLRPLRRAAP